MELVDTCAVRGLIQKSRISEVSWRYSFQRVIRTCFVRGRSYIRSPMHERWSQDHMTSALLDLLLSETQLDLAHANAYRFEVSEDHDAPVII